MVSAIRMINIENLPFSLIVTIIIAVLLLGFIIALKYRGNKTEKTFLLAMTILGALCMGATLVFVYIDTNYPPIFEKYETLIVSTTIVLFISLLLLSIANAIYKFKLNKTNNSN